MPPPTYWAAADEPHRPRLPSAKRAGSPIGRMRFIVLSPCATALRVTRLASTREVWRRLGVPGSECDPCGQVAQAVGQAAWPTAPAPVGRSSPPPALGRAPAPSERGRRFQFEDAPRHDSYLKFWRSGPAPPSRFVTMRFPRIKRK